MIKCFFFFVLCQVFFLYDRRFGGEIEEVLVSVSSDFLIF